MLTPHLQKRLDEKWNNCWPVSDLRPLALLDLISYLFFIKKLDDWELIHSKVKGAALDNFIYTKEIEEFTWSKLQSLNARQIQHLFNKEHGVIDLMNNYAHLNALFSDFFKAPLLIDPTPKLIFNSIEIINIIETSDKITQGAIIEYLFTKSKITAQNGHEFLPEYISRLLVAIAEPTPPDVVLDPCAGNGSLLINAYRYIADSDNLTNSSAQNKFIETNVSGLESDLIQLRLAAMNMVLHGIKNPKIRFAPVNSETINQNPTVIISSLLFPTQTVENAAETGKLEKENALLNEVIENLQQEGRAVVLVPQSLLKSDNPSIVKTRKTLVEHFNLEGVITLAPKSQSLFSSACILVFRKSQSSTENIWFCKWATAKKKKTVNEALGENGDDTNEMEEMGVREILNKWKYRNDKQKAASRNSFFISADYIKTNHYNLNFNDYKLVQQKEQLDSEPANVIADEPATIMAAKKENLHEFFEASAPLPQPTRRSRLAPTLVVLLILIIGAGAFYWFYLRDNHHHLYTRNKIPNTSNTIKVSNASDVEDADTTADFSNETESSTQPDSSNNTTQQNSSATAGATKYTVITKAWFHYQPDSTKKKPVFLEPRKDLILTPKDEKNGFVYVVYINSRGAATHGWLDKKDLEAVE
jgi:type I restriction enzyme M protein